MLGRIVKPLVNTSSKAFTQTFLKRTSKIISPSRLHKETPKILFSTGSKEGIKTNSNRLVILKLLGLTGAVVGAGVLFSHVEKRRVFDELDKLAHFTKLEKNIVEHTRLSLLKEYIELQYCQTHKMSVLIYCLEHLSKDKSEKLLKYFEEWAADYFKHAFVKTLPSKRKRPVRADELIYILKKLPPDNRIKFLNNIGMTVLDTFILDLHMKKDCSRSLRMELHDLLPHEFKPQQFEFIQDYDREKIKQFIAKLNHDELNKMFEKNSDLVKLFNILTDREREDFVCGLTRTTAEELIKKDVPMQFSWLTLRYFNEVTKEFELHDVDRNSFRVDDPDGIKYMSHFPLRLEFNLLNLLSLHSDEREKFVEYLGPKRVKQIIGEEPASQWIRDIIPKKYQYLLSEKTENEHVHRESNKS